MLLVRRRCIYTGGRWFIKRGGAAQCINGLLLRLITGGLHNNEDVRKRGTDRRSKVVLFLTERR